MSKDKHCCSFCGRPVDDGSAGKVIAGMDNSLTYCYSVEGGAEIAKEITMGVVPVIGSIYVEQYLGDFTPFGPAVTQALKSTDGVMIFDIVHLNKHKLWEELEAAMKAVEE